MDNTLFGVEPIRQRYVLQMGACIYTGLTPDQLETAQRSGSLRVSYTKNGIRCYSVDDLDAFMTGGAAKKKRKQEIRLA